MLSGLLRYWCLLVIFSALAVSALYRPNTMGNRVPELNNIVHNLERRSRQNYRGGSSNSGARRLVQPFQRFRSRSRHRYNEQRFADEMFRMFDRNSDNVIERDEFTSILILLGIIHY